MGRRGLDRLGTTIRKRSSHIPISTEIEAATQPQIVPRVLWFASSVKGTAKQVTTMVQKRGAKLPSVLDRNTIMCVGSAP